MRQCSFDKWNIECKSVNLEVPEGYKTVTKGKFLQLILKDKESTELENDWDIQKRPIEQHK